MKKTYKPIEESEIKNGGHAFHNYEHVKNVTMMAEKLLKDLEFDETWCLSEGE